MAIAAVVLLAILLSSFTYTTAKNPDILCTSTSGKYARHPIDCRRWFLCSSKPMLEMPRCILGKRFSLKTSTCVSITDSNNDCKGFCVYEGDQYFIGETFKGETVCEKCLCSDNRGTIICSDICKNATKCEKNDHLYGIGMYFMDSDGCNTCKCKPKVGIVCTKIACVTDKVFCFFGKNIYSSGDSFVHPDGQRNCICRLDGTAYCKFRNIKPVNSNPDMCIYMGNEYKSGDIFPLINVCNMCECLSNGKYICTKWNCPTKQTSIETPAKRSTSCNYKGKTYEIFAMFTGEDGCSKCSCLSSAKVTCDKRNCSTLISIGQVHTVAEKKKICTYNGQVYKVAEVFLSEDGCSKCTCPDSGEVKCVKKACSKFISVVHKALPKKFCTYNGHEYRVAQVFLGDDGCSKCSCLVFGEVTCVKTICIKKKIIVAIPATTPPTKKTCWHNGFEYKPKEEFTGVDGCSKCSCTDSGIVACIKQLCSKSNHEVTITAKTACIYNAHTYEVNEEFTATDGCSKCSCSGSGVVTCTTQVCSQSRNGQAMKRSISTPKKIYLSESCTYNNVVYKIGVKFMSNNGCDTCYCLLSKEIICTKKRCNNKIRTTTMKDDTSAICHYSGKIYIFGQIFISIDKCNQCSCMYQGKVECTQKICSSQSEAFLSENTTEKGNIFAVCRYDGHVYISGQTFPSVNKCNQCSCMSKGTITCTKKTCPTPQTKDITIDKISISIKCRYSGRTYIIGQTFISVDKCNKCGCKHKGKVSCTKNKCPVTTTEKSSMSSSVCHYKGKIFITGQIFMTVDKCNRCSCKPQGIITCTKHLCPSSQKEAYLTESGSKIDIFTVCHYNGRIYIFGQTFTSEDKCNQCSCKSKGIVRCTKKSACAPPEISVTCHYDGRAYKVGVTFNAADQCNKCTCKAKGNVDCTTKICFSSRTRATISVKCEYEGKMYIIGATFIAADHCNKCSCKPKGAVECTKKICLSSGSQVKQPSTTLIGCHYNGNVYIFGQTFAAIDKCNQCACMTKGSVVCTKKICLSTDIQVARIECNYDGNVYIIGQIFMAGDKCNQCTCKASGDVICSDNVCPPSKVTVTKIECHYNGEVYVIGQTFIAIDKCNYCSCKISGVVVCTENKCPFSKATVTRIQCQYNGNVYIIGQMFIAIDKCNQCTCKSSGAVVCTGKVCHFPKTTVTKIECRYNGDIYVIGQTFVAIDECNHCSCKFGGVVICTEKPCSPPKSSVTRIECRYNGKIYVIGEKFIAVDKCNHCTCKSKEAVVCTESICPSSKVTTMECHYDGKVYVTGQTFIAIDQCNQCTCKFTGDIICTEKICPISKTTVTRIGCNYKGKVYVIGQTFIAIDKCNHCTCKFSGAVVCSEKICHLPKSSVARD